MPENNEVPTQIRDFPYTPLASLMKGISGIFPVALAFFILGVFGYKEPLYTLLMTPRFSMAMAVVIGVVMAYRMLESMAFGMFTGRGLAGQYQSIWMPVRVALIGVLVLPMGSDKISLLSEILCWTLSLGDWAGK